MRHNVTAATQQPRSHSAAATQQQPRSSHAATQQQRRQGLGRGREEDCTSR